jgi:hypothetical protein
MGGDNKGDIPMFDEINVAAFEDSENNKICECCGAKVVTYTHRINKGLTIAMKRLYDAGRTAHLESLPLTTSQRSNFQKLKYWGLVKQSSERSGVWVLTDRGTNFVEGRTAELSHAASYRATPVELSEEKKKHAKLVMFKDIYPYEIQDKETVRYKQREEYAEDAEPFYTG